MNRALDLARRGAALAHPNPTVGAVLVRNGRVVGEAFHAYDGRKHAEIVALEKAGGRARGATLYCTLEPCCHTGRTGPCTQALIAAGVERVVVPLLDPNPAVFGRGLRELCRAGLQVSLATEREEAERLNEAFARWIRTRKPLVTLKAALTLDGQIASPDRSERWISSAASRREVQFLRHVADAVMTGAGTVLADNPRLTDRTGLRRRRPLLRVVVDSHLRIPPGSRLVESASNDVLVFTTRPLDSPRARALRRRGVEVVRVPSHGGHADLEKVILELGAREILGVLVEAGSALNGALLRGRLVDKMILFFAPKVIGEVAAPLALSRFPSLAEAPRLRHLRLERYGPDFAVEGYFRDVYRNHPASRSH